MPRLDEMAGASRPAPAITVTLALLLVVFLAATLPYLEDFPLMTADQTGIAAPAWKLARTGVYGNDMYAGFFRTEELNYEYMPLYPLLVAASYRLFGLGVVPARAVSIACGGAVLLLVFALGRRIAGSLAGVLAAGSLCFLRLGVSGGASGVPLVDLSRFIRYDILVPVWVVAAGLCVLTAESKGKSLLAAGVCIGMATLAHVYGAFFLLPVPLCLVTWHGARVLVSRRMVVLLAGFALPLIPWVAYILRDTRAYSGQMTRHSERISASAAFLLDSLVREKGRWSPWLRAPDGQLALFPRPGLWVLLLCLVVLAATSRSGGARSEDERRGRDLVLASLIVLPLCLGLFVSFKRYPYVLLVLPFLCIAVGLVLADLWRLSRSRSGARAVLVVVFAAVVVEGAFGIVAGLRTARRAPSYRKVCGAIARFIPPHERVLCLHHYWLGLPGYDFRALDLAKVLSESRYPHERQRTFPEAVDSIDPGFVVLEEGMMANGRTKEYHVVNPSAARFWDELSAYLSSRCDRVGAVVDDDYGTIGVYERRRPTPLTAPLPPAS